MTNKTAPASYITDTEMPSIVVETMVKVLKGILSHSKVGNEDGTATDMITGRSCWDEKTHGDFS